MKLKDIQFALACILCSLVIDSVAHNLHASSAPLPGRDDWGQPFAQPPAYHSDPFVRATGAYDRSNVFPHGGTWTFAPTTPAPAAGGGNWLLDFWHWLIH